MSRWALLALSSLALVLAGCSRSEEGSASTRTERVVSGSASFSDSKEQSDFEAALKQAGIPYTIETRDGQRYATWSGDHQEAVSRVKAEVSGKPLPPGRNLSASPALQEKFKAWLSANAIPYKVQQSNGREYIVWEEADAARVRTWAHFPL